MKRIRSEVSLCLSWLAMGFAFGIMFAILFGLSAPREHVHPVPPTLRAEHLP